MVKRQFSTILCRIFCISQRPPPASKKGTRAAISLPYNVQSSAPIRAPGTRVGPTRRYSYCRPTHAEERPCSELSMTCAGIDSLMCSEGEELEIPDEDISVPCGPWNDRRRRADLEPVGFSSRLRPAPLDITKTNQLCTVCTNLPARDTRGLCRKCAPRPESEFTISAYGRDSFCYTKPEIEPEVESPTLPFERYFRITEYDARSPLDDDDEGSIDFRNTYYGALYSNWIADDAPHSIISERWSNTRR